MRRWAVGLVLQWLIVAASVWLAAELVPGITLEGWESTLVVGAILGLLNLFVRPVLKLVSLPLMILSFGLFVVVINTGLLALTAWIAGQFDDLLFSIEDFMAALLGAIVITLAGFVIGTALSASGKRRAF
ncbi:MAG: phage holin family protein [Dehalococcoidia bacterium]|nr:phage holin family protein [Dehalococcoidia bacterium]